VIVPSRFSLVDSSELKSRGIVGVLEMPYIPGITLENYAFFSDKKTLSMIYAHVIDILHSFHSTSYSSEEEKISVNNLKDVASFFGLDDIDFSSISYEFSYGDFHPSNVLLVKKAIPDKECVVLIDYLEAGVFPAGYDYASFIFSSPNEEYARLFYTALLDSKVSVPSFSLLFLYQCHILLHILPNISSKVKDYVKACYNSKTFLLDIHLRNMETSQNDR
jgi:hypothetical protein